MTILKTKRQSQRKRLHMHNLLTQIFIILAYLSLSTLQKKLEVEFPIYKLKRKKLIYLKKMNLHNATNLYLNVSRTFKDRKANSVYSLKLLIFDYKNFSLLRLFQTYSMFMSPSDKDSTLFQPDPKFPPEQNKRKKKSKKQEKYLINRSLNCTQLLNRAAFNEKLDLHWNGVDYFE